MANRLLRWIASSAVMLLVSTTDSEAQSAKSRLGEIAAGVLRDFEEFGADNPADCLRRLRPASVRPSFQAAVLASLPADGEVEITPEMAKKLSALEAVLDFHDRGTVFAVKVIRIRQAKVALLERCILLISEHALELLTPEELAAHAAHEVGHEYFWCDYAAARLGNPAELHKLEFRCDAVSALTMASLGYDPKALLRGVEKLNQFNKGIGAMANAACYPSLQERRRVVQALGERCGRTLQTQALARP